MNGMDDNEDEHNFSDDDDFGNLEDDALQRLEHNAILSTQRAASQRHAPAKTVPVSQSRNFANVQPHLQNAIIDPFDPDDFELVEPDQVPTPVEYIERPTYHHSRPPGETTQREQARLQKYGNSTTYSRNYGQPPQRRGYQRDAPQQTTTTNMCNASRTTSATYSAANDVSRTMSTTFGAANETAPAQADLASSKVEELMRERDALMAQLQEAKDQVMTKVGEISIIRENKDKETKVYDRQLAAMKKSMQEESARQKTAIESLTSKHNSLITEYNMTKDDLKEETRRIKTLETRLKDKSANKQDGAVLTPKKQRPANSLRDGFDDDEVMVMSPSKSAPRRSKPNTPTVPGKKKRKVDASPVKPLVLWQPDDTPQHHGQDSPQIVSNFSVPVIRKDRQTARDLKLIQNVINYQPKFKSGKLIEILIAFQLPSRPNQSFSSIVLDAVARLHGPGLATDLLQIFIDLWSQSIAEKYYDCVGLLIEVVDYITDLRTSVIDKGVITSLLPVLQDSASINGSARFKHSPVYRANYGQFKQTPASALTPLVDTTVCLGLLYKIAGLCLDSEQLIDHFWRLMSTEFVLMMLNIWQPISDITLMLHLLATSIFHTTFGNICSDTSTQSTMENHIIARVSSLLWETPKVDEGLPSPSRSDLCRFRLEALALLSSLACEPALLTQDGQHHHGSVLLASHPSAIARLVRILYDSVAGLYLMTPSSPLYAQIINHGVRLLYHLMTTHGDDIDLQQKLAAVNGGVHKHRVVLTRLAFSEGWFIDSDVTDETCAMATAMLEDSVTPDEAEMMIQAFPGFNGRKREKVPHQQSENDDSMAGVE
jgi:hypothetical protein